MIEYLSSSLTSGAQLPVIGVSTTLCDKLVTAITQDCDSVTSGQNLTFGTRRVRLESDP